MVVYLDVLFAVNALMDGATLLAAARLGGVQVRKMRLIFSAAFGGGYAVLGAVWPVLTLAPLRLLAGLGLCMIAFGRERHLARLCALYGVVAASFAGLAAALSAASGRRLLLSCGYYFAVPMQVLVLAAAVGYAASGILLCGDAKHGALHRETETLTIRFGTRQTAVRVLHDTGNDLTEPVSGKPVVVLERKAAECLLDTKLPFGSASAQLTALPENLAARCGLLPFHAVGTDGGLLLYFRPDSVLRADGTALECVCAVSAVSIGQGAYEGLIGV